MTEGKGHRYTIAASVVAALGVLVFFASDEFSNSTESLPEKPTAHKYEQKAKSSDEQRPAIVSDEHSVIDDSSRSEQDRSAYDTRVSIDVNGAEVDLMAAEATLHEVLDRFVDKALVELVDRRPDDESAGEDKQLKRRSFRISGTVDDVLLVVMREYDYSYVISHFSSAESPLNSPAIKLFLFGVMQREDTTFADEHYLTGTDGESIPVARHVESEAINGVDLEISTREKVTVSELLRNRVLLSDRSYSAQKHNPSDSSWSNDNEPLSGFFDDEGLRSRLADMRFRALQGVQTLAEGLKQAEKTLEAPAQ